MVKAVKKKAVKKVAKKSAKKIIRVTKANTYKIRLEFKEAIRAVIKSPLKLKGFYSSEDRELLVGYDTPREYRYPDEYRLFEEDLMDDEKYVSFRKVEAEISKVCNQFNQKYPKYFFNMGGGIFGPVNYTF